MNSKTSYLLIACGLLLGLYSTPLAGQDNTVTETFSNRPLAEVFDVFSNKYNLLLAYDESVVANHTVHISFENEEVVAALYQVLNQAQLSYYTLDERQILIRSSSKETPPAVNLRHLRGQIIDKETGESLGFATIMLSGTTIGVVADTEGYFSLSWPDTLGPTPVVEARYLGYVTQRMPCPQRRANFALAALSQSLGVIVVTDRASTLRLVDDEQAIELKPATLLPGVGSQVDILRSMQLLPGVAAHNDRSASLNVRGSQADENMISWDGMILYHVDHFFGAFGAVNANMVESVKLYKNTFPVAYGGRTGAILSIQSPTEIQKAKTNLQLGSLLMEGSSLLPLTSGMSLQIGGRTTFNNVAKSDFFGILNQEVNLPVATTSSTANTQIISSIQPHFSFYDLNAKWAWQINNNTYLDANFYRSADDYHYNYEQTIISRRLNRTFTNLAMFNEMAQWQNEASSLRWQQDWSPTFRQEWTFGQSEYQINEGTNNVLEAETLNNNTIIVDSRIARSNNIKSRHANLKNSWLLQPDGKLIVGSRIIQEQVIIDINNENLNILQNENQAIQVAAYAAWEKQYAKGSWMAGLHTTHYSATSKLYWSPRLSGRLQLNDNWQLKASANHYYQFLRAYYHENRFGRTITVWSLADDTRFPVAQSSQAMLGFTFRDGNFGLDVEAYYKRTTGVLEHSSILNGFQQDSVGSIPSGRTSFRLSEGVSKIIGLDLLLSQRWGKYDTWLSYSWSKSRRQFEELFRGESYAAQDDRPHQINWVNTYQSGVWSCSAVYVFASGRPYQELSLGGTAPDRTLSSPISERIPAYHRVDLSVKREWDLDKASIHLSASIYNLFNRKNTLYSQRIFRIPQENNRDILLGNELELLNRSLGISLGLDF